MKKPVRIFITGGTIDKVHDPYTEALSFAADGSTQVPEILHYGRCHFPVTQVLMLIDSLNMTDSDREQIAVAVRQAGEQAFVVTHGTGTMGETARYLEKALKGAGKTVVLTGAMRPTSLFHSDGPFNLGGAVVAAQLLEPGIYGVMNGRIMPAASLNKNTDLGRFDV